MIGHDQTNTAGTGRCDGFVDHLKSAEIAKTLMRAHPKLKGLWPMLRCLLDDNWIDDPVVTPAIEAMLVHQLTFDALVLPRQLLALTRSTQPHPHLPIVIDHAAKPLIADRAMQPWLGQMQALAALPQVYCALSGLLTEARQQADQDSVRPYAQAVLSAFGP